jgi:hypothetical protein
VRPVWRKEPRDPDAPTLEPLHTQPPAGNLNFVEHVWQPVKEAVSDDQQRHREQPKAGKERHPVIVPCR